MNEVESFHAFVKKVALDKLILFMLVIIHLLYLKLIQSVTQKTLMLEILEIIQS